MTPTGGAYGLGTVYQLQHGTWTLNVVHAFTGGNDGTNPPAGVTLESPDLRQQVAAAIDRDREHAQRASDAVRRRVRQGTASLGPAEDR